ncbi:Uncharacterised protein [Zhongshania aliphaticivorans]|uniref:Uncharacterized protein n=2 Tax=Zhongshania aliphaticivorans TaxID=1470434 RepID=A0A5S9MWC9_9GAMM|nr:Uncharacterised protein [Zhongshania aliphaticivorans]CAA0085186.1 Uncharacterised protein [Zhongshania aliphaticivorans]
MVNVTARTNGEKIEVRYSRISTHPNPEIKGPVAYLDLDIGDLSLSIAFSTAQEMIEFCEAHNFPYEDDREVAA